MPTKKNTSTAAAETEEKIGTDVAVYDEEMAGLLAEDNGTGLEETDGDSFSIPYLLLLQALSPIVQDNAGDPNFVQGLFMNSVSQETMKEVEFIPCHYQRRFIAWAQSGSRGGASFRGMFTPSEVEGNTLQDIEKDGNKYIWTNEEGETCDLVDTRIHYIMYKNPNTDTFEPAIISLSGTQVKQSKRLITMARTVQVTVNGKKINPPSWAFVYKATSIKQKNEKGQWFGWEFNRCGQVTDAVLFRACKELHDSVLSGETKMQAPQKDVEAAPVDDGNPNDSEDKEF